MHNKSKAFTVLGQEFSIVQEFRCTLLGEIARRLPSGRAQQIEGFPVQLDDVVCTVETDKADNFPAIRQWNSQPWLIGGERPCLGFLFRGALLDPAAIAEAGNKGVVHRQLPVARKGPTPRCRRIITYSSTQRPQHAGRAVDKFCQGTDDSDRELLGIVASETSSINFSHSTL